MLIRWMFGVIPLLVAEILLSQRLPVQTYTTKEGLPSNIVTEIVQDSRGFLWIGTDDGIAVFDGDKFRRFRFADTSAVGYVNDIVESRITPGLFWIATNGGGIMRFNGEGDSLIKVDAKPEANAVNSILENTDGSLWCATDAGLYRYADGMMTSVVSEERDVYPHLVRDGEGTVWYYDEQRLLRFNESRQTLEPHTIDGLPSDSIIIVSRLPDSSVAVHVKESKQASVYIVKHGRIQHHFRVLSSHAVFTTLTDDGRYIIGTPDGLYEYRQNGEQWVLWIYTTTNGLTTNELTIGYCDREQNVWFGSFGRGLTKLELQRSVQFVLPGMSGRGTVDPAGHVWIPTSHGIYELWNDSVGLWKRALHTLRDEKGVMMVPVSVVADSLRELWCSFSDGRLGVIEVKRQSKDAGTVRLRRIFSSQHSVPRALAITLLIDSHRTLWFGLHFGGLAGLDLRTEKITALFRYGMETTLGDVRELFEDSKGRIWALGLKPVNRIIRRAGHTYVLDSTDADLQRIPSYPMRAVRETPDGTFWFGSRYHGLFAMSNENVDRLGVEQGLISNQISSLEVTGTGDLVVGTQAGLMMLRDPLAPRFISLQQYVNSPVQTLLFRSRVFIAITRFDVTIFENPRMIEAPRSPSVLLQSVTVGGKSRTIGETIDLGSGEGTFTIEYTAVSFRNPGALRFQVRLEPLETEWRYPTSSRSVTYASLPPGEYRFSVRALDQQGIPSGIVTSVPITLASPVWMRWWFLLLVSLGIISLVIIAERARVRRLVEIEKIRARIAADLHDDIGSGLTRIALLSDMIRQQTPQSEQSGNAPFSIPVLTEKVGTISRELVEAMSDVVWSIDPKNSSMDRLLQRIRTFAVEVCEAKEILLNFNAPPELSRRTLASDTVRAVLLVAKEALTNVVRHSSARAVSVTLTLGPGTLEIVIADDGAGFDIESLSRQNGITNMRNRIEKQGGVFTLISQRGSGTTVRAVIPMGSGRA